MNKRLLKKLIRNIFDDQTIADLSCFNVCKLSFEKLKSIIKYLPYSISTLDLSGNKLFAFLSFEQIIELISVIPEYIDTIILDIKCLESSSHKNEMQCLLDESEIQLILI